MDFLHLTIACSSEKEVSTKASLCLIRWLHGARSSLEEAWQLVGRCDPKILSPKYLKYDTLEIALQDPWDLPLPLTYLLRPHTWEKLTLLHL